MRSTISNVLPRYSFSSRGSWPSTAARAAKPSSQMGLSARACALRASDRLLLPAACPRPRRKRIKAVTMQNEPFILRICSCSSWPSAPASAAAPFASIAFAAHMSKFAVYTSPTMLATRHVQSASTRPALGKWANTYSQHPAPAAARAGQAGCKALSRPARQADCLRRARLARAQHDEFSAHACSTARRLTCTSANQVRTVENQPRHVPQSRR